MSSIQSIPKTAIIVAGGTGTRMGIDKPKQFLLLNGQPVLYHTLQSFFSSYDDMDIVLVLPEAHLDEGKQVADLCSANRSVRIVTGGATRWESVRNGLKQVQHQGIVLVHDGVRCLIQPDLIRRCCELAWSAGSAIPVVPATDSIRIIEGNKSRVADRNLIRLVQTPQTFQVTALQEAFDRCTGNDFTDEAAVWEAAGKEVALIDGAHDNIKITRPIDLLLAEAILQQRSSLNPSERKG
jgi:2-C-methyl-D-erythritol 4-phosphate cytidylyltransferase